MGREMGRVTMRVMEGGGALGMQATAVVEVLSLLVQSLSPVL